MPKVGLEPTSLSTVDFESTAVAISPLRHVYEIYTKSCSFSIVYLIFESLRPILSTNMHTPETIRVGEKYLFPKRAPGAVGNDGFIHVVVQDIRNDEHGDYVVLESKNGPLREMPYIVDFCAEVNLSEIMNLEPA